jgi:ribose transport system substrate-binding protein
VVDKYVKPGKIYIVGFDALPETLAYIRNGTINATVVQEPYEMGYRAVKMMINLIQGKTVEPIVHTNTRIMRIVDLPVSNRYRMEESN